MNSKIFCQYDLPEFKTLLKDALKEVLEEVRTEASDQVTLINIQEAAAYLNLAVATIYEKTSQRTIPHYKHGKKILFKKSELLAWVESRRVKTIHEIRKDAARRW